MGDGRNAPKNADLLWRAALLRAAPCTLLDGRKCVTLSETGALILFQYGGCCCRCKRARVMQRSSFQHWASLVIAAVLSTIHLLLQHSGRLAKSSNMCVSERERVCVRVCVRVRSGRGERGRKKKGDATYNCALMKHKQYSLRECVWAGHPNRPKGSALLVS